MRKGSLKEFFIQFFVKTVERSTDEEETKTITTVQPIPENCFKISELFTTQVFQRKIPKLSDRENYSKQC